MVSQTSRELNWSMGLRVCGLELFPLETDIFPGPARLGLEEETHDDWVVIFSPNQNEVSDNWRQLRKNRRKDRVLQCFGDCDN